MSRLHVMSKPLVSSIAGALLAGLILSLGPIDTQAQRIAATVDSTKSVIDYTGSATMHDWTGTSRDVSGTMVLDVDTPDSSRVVVRASVASFESGRDRRDRRMREVTEAEKYPTVEFRATDIRPTHWGRTNEGQGGRWQVTGDLTFHGQTHPVEAAVDVQTTEDSVHARAQFPVSLTRFDVERPELLWMAPIGDTIRIDARVVGAIESTATRASRLETTQSEVTGAQRVASTDLRNVEPLRFSGTSAGLHAGAHLPSEGAREWILALYGFADEPVDMADAQEVVLRADEQVVKPLRVEGTRRQLDDGTTVEISRMYFTRPEFETLADALTATVILGPARFSLDWRSRRDMRLLLDAVSSDASRPVSVHDED